MIPSLLLTSLALSGCMLWLLVLLLDLCGTSSFLTNSRKPRPELRVSELPGISVLKPLKGVDCGLESNLESFFRLDYPRFELIFSVADPLDPVLQLLESLTARFPDVNSRVLVTSPQSRSIPPSSNPKVNNLLLSYECVLHDVLLISDSNVRMAPDDLTRMVEELQCGVGMVTSVISGEGARGLGGHLEAVFLNSYYARGMVFANAAGHPCVVGKSMLFRKSTADRFGGLRVLIRYLAEDYMAGIAVSQLGLQIAIPSRPVSQHIGKHAFADFWQRHLRWGRIRKSQAPLVFWSEPFMLPWTAAIIGSTSLKRFFPELDPGAFIAVHLLIHFMLDCLVMTANRGELKFQTPWVWCLRELLAFPLWVHIALGKTVVWRGQRLNVEMGGLLK